MSHAYHCPVVHTDDRGPRRTRVYAMPGADYWGAVTDVPCPACDAGTIRWHEAGYVPGYRICDGCGRHWQASGERGHRVLILMRSAP
jgi:hypothetical protein